MNLVKTTMFGLIGIVLGHMYKTKEASRNFDGRDACLLNWYYAHLCCEYKVFNIDLMKQMQNMFNESMAQSEKIVTAAGMPISKEQKSYLHNLMMCYKRYSQVYLSWSQYVFLGLQL